MKKTIIILLLLCSVKAFSQNFEGIIRWSVKTDVTDPKQKAQMEEAQKRMADPANQAKMKEMQEKMNDPQMKAMMDSNPQMKAQMDAMMAGMQGGGGLSSLMPSALTIKIKDENSLTKVEGGMFSSEILHLKNKDQAYSLDRAKRTYSIMNPPASDTKELKDADVKVTKTNETTKVLNYTCIKYIVDVTTNGKKTTQFVWATPEIKDFDFSALSKQRFGKGQRLFFEDIEGVPLKMEMNMHGASMKMEVTEIKKQPLNTADFTIPADYKEVPGMFK